MRAECFLVVSLTAAEPGRRCGSCIDDNSTIAPERTAAKAPWGADSNCIYYSKINIMNSLRRRCFRELLLV